MIHHEDDWLTIHGGDCREVLRTLPAESVHCVVTSPPYWGLRDYGTASWNGGGDPACDHLGPSAKPSPKSTLGVYADGRTRYKDGWDSDRQAKADFEGTPYRETCRKCGATRIDSQLGLEATPEEYVATLVDVFREVRRVLRPDGTLWLNLGDSYAGGGGFWPDAPSNVAGAKQTTQKGSIGGGIKPQGIIKPKDLVGIPWRVAFALQADGWYLRSDIIWSKPNPMPESVTDRPTKSHEYLFLLAKSPRYYFDADAVREGYSDKTEWTYPQPDKAPRAGVTTNGTGASTLRVEGAAGRNIRSVWTIATAPYPGAHFATFPPKLVEPCIKAGCPEGGVVLDPFAGTGTVGMVAQQLSRRAVLIDLNPDYLAQCLARNAAIPMGL